MCINKRLNRFFCLFLTFVLCFSFLPVVNASASSVLSDQEYYAYWYADNYCGVDWSQYSSTDDGSTIEDYTQRKGQKSFSQAIEDVAGEVQTAADTTYTRVYDAAKETVSKAYTTTAKAAEYVAEKANRTLETAAGTAYSVAGGSFWSSVFNDLFNNDGYKEQYVNGSENYTIDGINYNITGSINSPYGSDISNPFDVNVYKVYNNITNIGFYNTITPYQNDKIPSNVSTRVTFKMNDVYLVYSISSNELINHFGLTYYSEMILGTYLDTNSNRIVTTLNGEDFGSIRPKNRENIITSNGSTIGDKQVGFIRLPNGDIVPVYTDKTKNDFDINDNGTVTLPNGDVVPIYIYPDELNPVGQTQILKFINTMPFQLPFGTNDSLPISSDGEGGSFLEGLGQLIGDIFSGLFDGLVEVLKTIADIIKGLFNLIAGLFKGDYFNNLKFQLFDFNPFDIIKSGISKIFELFGVVIS